MKFLDLFAGIGGIRLGLEANGHECVGYVEDNSFARQSYQAIHNTENEWTREDITKVTDAEFAELKDNVDMIVGGPPCQAFSISGKRLGFADETRGTLFFDMLRAVKQIQPKYMLMENVKGLVNHDGGNTFDVMLRAIEELGYTPDYTVLNSKYFGVAQNRERIFIVAVRNDIPFEPFMDNLKRENTTVTQHLIDVLCNENLPLFVTQNDRTDALVNKVKGNEFDFERVDKLVTVGHTGRTEHNSTKVYWRYGIAPTLTARDFKGPKQIVDNVENEPKVRKLTPLEYWRLQGFKDDHFRRASEVVSKSQLYKQAGNSVSVPVIAAIVGKINEVDALLENSKIKRAV